MGRKSGGSRRSVCLERQRLERVSYSPQEKELLSLILKVDSAIYQLLSFRKNARSSTMMNSKEQLIALLRLDRVVSSQRGLIQSWLILLQGLLSLPQIKPSKSSTRSSLGRTGKRLKKSHLEVRAVPLDGNSGQISLMRYLES